MHIHILLAMVAGGWGWHHKAAKKLWGNFFESIVDLQCCVSFKCTVVCIYIYIYIYSFPDSGKTAG